MPTTSNDSLKFLNPQLALLITLLSVVMCLTLLIVLLYTIRKQMVSRKIRKFSIHTIHFEDDNMLVNGKFPKTWVSGDSAITTYV
ncbi:unnamed protein product [Caenorhabditis nigoni]